MVSLSNTHLFQSEWQPYQNQPGLGISYLWNTPDAKLAIDAGFSMSFSTNTCNQCISSNADEQTYDADIFSLHFGAGKWWRSEKTSTFLTSGIFGAFSEYKMVTPIAGTPDYKAESSGRGHTGLYIRSGLDFKMNQKGFRLGPFLESRISTSSAQKGLSLNASSFIAGLFFAWRQESP